MAAGFSTQANIAASDNGSFAIKRRSWDGWVVDELTVDETQEERHVG